MSCYEANGQGAGGFPVSVSWQLPSAQKNPYAMFSGGVSAALPLPPTFQLLLWNEQPPNLRGTEKCALL